ncbi:MAG: GNAT family N-acetyltransferase [Symbiobacterium sp.]|uniref:GNAT family N-acetyltransferase n=1 Tax=Symbiobacterium sp. TaxID=1971213 RepID=UPI003464A9DB
MFQLITPRLRLRPLEADDAADVQALASDADVSARMLNMTLPLASDGGAAAWIAEQQAGWETGTRYGFAIRTGDSDAFVGVVTLRVNREAGRAELGYAVTAAAQGKGYATEAAREVLRFAFTGLDLQRVTAHCLASNTASRRVLEKLGFRQEAHLEFEDPAKSDGFALLFYGLNRDEHRADR